MDPRAALPSRRDRQRGRGGRLMMAHDWKDRAMWFERDRGSQR
jgi:hypothetical protein